MRYLIYILILHIPDILTAQHVDSWLEQNAISILTCNPDSQIEDLKAVSRFIDKCQVIGLGETSHGQGSFFEMKHRFFKYAVEELGYNVFALEAGLAECFRINEYVLHGKGDAESALKYLNYGVWEIRELKDLIEYMRFYNNGHRHQVKFYGFDCQMAFGAIDYLLSIQDEINYIPNQHEEQLFIQLQQLQQTRESKEAKLLQPLLTAWIAKLNALINQSTQLDNADKLKARIICRSLEQFCENEVSGTDETRARFMAENVAHIMELEGADTKIVLSAHNGHIFKAPKAQEFGHYLEKEFGEKYYAVGFDFNRGKIQGFDFTDDAVHWKEYELTPAKRNTLGDILLQCRKDYMFLDLRQARNNSSLPKWFYKHQTCGDILGCYGQKGCNKRYWRINISESYDAIVFFKQTERANKI